MTQTQTSYDTDRLLDVVIEVIEVQGCESVQLRDVARRARTSLATIYKYFPSRDELIVAAVERWMGENIYLELEGPMPKGSLYARLMWLLRHVYEPWERHPAMLAAFVRASVTAGDRLHLQGLSSVKRIGPAVYEGVDPELAAEINSVVTYVTYGALTDFVRQNISVKEILPILERTVRLVSTNADRPLRGSVDARPLGR